MLACGARGCGCLRADDDWERKAQAPAREAGPAAEALPEWAYPVSPAAPLPVGDATAASGEPVEHVAGSAAGYYEIADCEFVCGCRLVSELASGDAHGGSGGAEARGLRLRALPSAERVGTA